VLILTEFILKVANELQQAGYITDPDPHIPGIQALLYAHSPNRYRLGFAKIEDHFLFVDWGNAAFGRLDRLQELYAHFRTLANKAFRVPHALRMQIPNLALVALAEVGFPEEAVRFVRSTYLNPWYGGETGQIILVVLDKKQINTHSTPGRRQPGAYPLVHAAEIIREKCKQAFLSPE
jgi:hypothetical protein